MNTDAAEVMLKALAQATAPLTAKQLRDQLTGPYKLSVAELTEALDAAVANGTAHRIAPARRNSPPRYTTRAPEALAENALLKLLRQRPHTRAELLRRAQPTLKAFGIAEGSQLLAQLIRAGQAQELAPFLGGRAKLYSAQSAQPRDYVEDALKKLGAKFGLSREALLRVAGLMPAAHVEAPATQAKQPPQTAQAAEPANAPMADPGEALLARMVQVKLAAAQGALVPLNTLWRSLQHEGWRKADFDRTVLSLAESYRVSLQRHNFPASLSEEERAELVADEAGNHYVGIALR